MKAVDDTHATLWYARELRHDNWVVVKLMCRMLQVAVERKVPSLRPEHIYGRQSAAALGEGRFDP